MLGWTVKSFIVKAGDDLRKEVLAMQLIEYCQHVFGIEGLDISLRPYQIVSTGQQSGKTHLPLHSAFMQFPQLRYQYRVFTVFCFANAAALLTS